MKGDHSAQSVNRISREGGRIEKKTIRQHYNMTPASAEAEVGLSFSSLLRSVLGQGIHKLINKVQEL